MPKFPQYVTVLVWRSFRKCIKESEVLFGGWASFSYRSQESPIGHGIRDPLLMQLVHVQIVWLPPCKGSCKRVWCSATFECVISAFTDGCLAEEQREFYLTGFVLVDFWIQKWSYLVSYETQAGGVVHHDWPFFMALPHPLYSLSWLGMQIEQVDVYFSENNPSPLSRSSSWKNSLPLPEGKVNQLPWAHVTNAGLICPVCALSSAVSAAPESTCIAPSLCERTQWK